MAPARKTRSGRSAPAPSPKRDRTKAGCLTCRIRRKKCDESRHFAGGCETCSRLHIECLGYSTKRPEWLKGQQVDHFKRLIKHFLADHSAKSSSRAQDDAFLYLRPSRSLPTQPAQRFDSDVSESDSDVELPPVTSAVFAYDSPVDMGPDLNYWTNGDPWSPLNSTLQLGWDIPADSFASPGTDDVEGFLADVPELIEFPTDMLSSNEHNLFAMLTNAPDLQITTAPWDPYRPEQQLPAVWDSFLAALQIQNTGPLHDALHEVLQSDPEGIDAMCNWLSAAEQDKPLQARAAIHRLARAGYDRTESRALTALWMLASTLSSGHFGSWETCLDVLLGWIHNISAQPFTVPDLTEVEQLVLKRSIWLDIIAGATTKRTPRQIELYRRVLASSEPDVLDGCPNTAALAMAETAALAANPNLLDRARTRLDQLRSSLPSPQDEDEPTKAAVHTAGVRLYIESIAHRGDINHPAVRQAVHDVCALTGEMGQRREFGFWVFLAGCHTEDPDRWANCSTMLHEIVQDSGDASVAEAFGVMNAVRTSRQQSLGLDPQWREQMTVRRALLV